MLVELDDTQVCIVVFWIHVERIEPRKIQYRNIRQKNDSGFYTLFSVYVIVDFTNI